MNFELEEAIQMLERTPRVLNALLRDQPAEWLNCRIEPKAFSPIDVLGHLMFADIDDWIPRARRILELQDSRPFEPFDRRGFGPLIAGKSVDQLLREFSELRGKTIKNLRSFELHEAQLDLPGRHPELGAVTMRQLLATWVVHDWNHIDQILRTLSSQYAEQVGPWKAFLGILNR
jgi:DinB superfamily